MVILGSAPAGAPLLGRQEALHGLGLGVLPLVFYLYGTTHLAERACDDGVIFDPAKGAGARRGARRASGWG